MRIRFNCLTFTEVSCVAHCLSISGLFVIEKKNNTTHRSSQMTSPNQIRTELQIQKLPPLVAHKEWLEKIRFPWCVLKDVAPWTDAANRTECSPRISFRFLVFLVWTARQRWQCAFFSGNVVFYIWPNNTACRYTCGILKFEITNTCNIQSSARLRPDVNILLDFGMNLLHY